MCRPGDLHILRLAFFQLREWIILRLALFQLRKRVILRLAFLQLRERVILRLAFLQLRERVILFLTLLQLRERILTSCFRCRASGHEVDYQVGNLFKRLSLHHFQRQFSHLFVTKITHGLYGSG